LGKILAIPKPRKKGVHNGAKKYIFTKERNEGSKGNSGGDQASKNLTGETMRVGSQWGRRGTKKAEEGRGGEKTS